MSPLKKRIFVGNLPPGTVEADLIKKFQKYGKINSVEVKQRGDSSTFAFLDLESDYDKFIACFANVPRKSWNGYKVKLEVAQESFLSRLAKEREHQSTTKVSTETPERPAQLQVKKDSRKDTPNSPHKQKLSNDSILNKESSESYDSSSEVECKGKLKMFRGTKHFLSTSKQNTSNTTQLKKNKKIKTLQETEVKAEQNLEAEKDSSDILQRLEMFSDLWKDSFDDQPAKTYRQKNDARSAKAEEKRIKSVAEKRKSFQKQKEAIKMALSNVDTKRSNKKITFEEDMDTSNYTEATHSAPDDQTKSSAKKYKLFEDDAEEEVPDLKIKSQFEGRKGQKMLELQSRYAHDERFALDEKFYESDNEEDSSHEDMNQDDEEEDEKKKQLKILENVLGHSVEPLSVQKKKAKVPSMLRFDPTKPDHAKFEQKVEKKHKVEFEDSDSLPKFKKPKLEEPKPVSVPVSKDTFYKVTDTLKDALQNKGQSSGFSLREMFGSNEQDSIKEEYETTTLKKEKKIGWTSNPFKYDSSGSDEEDDVKEEAAAIPTPPQEDNNMSMNTDFHEKFFFTHDDPRFQEGIDFIRNAQKHNQSFEDFVKLRRELKQIIRTKVKKIKLKKRPFKKKLGGQKNRNKRKV